MLDKKTTASKRGPAPSARTAVTHVAGPISDLAEKTYFDRGSKPVIEMTNWRLIAFILAGAVVSLAVAIASLIPLKTVETVTVTKLENGRLTAESSTTRVFVADDVVKQAWVNEWVTRFVEVNPSTWSRDSKRTLMMTVGSGTDQANDYMRREENNPAWLLSKNPGYVREMKRQSINLLSSDIVLIRYTLTSRAAAGIKSVKSFAITVNLKKITPASVEDAIENPSGLMVGNFSISEESK